MLNLNEFLFVKGRPVETIGGLVPIGKTTLLHGRSGAGKTLSMLKFLIINDVKPIFIDFDYNDEYNDMPIIHIDGYKIIDAIKAQNHTLKELAQTLAGSTIVIDTYVMLERQLEELGTTVMKFCRMLEVLGTTVVVIAHTNYYAGKAPEPQCDTVFANHVGCRLHLYHTYSKKTKQYDTYLEVEKLRGVKQEIIQDWMRDEDSDALYSSRVNPIFKVTTQE